jgi:hypothetical protein
MNRKPRADSVLATLPEERQDAIAELCRTKTLDEVVQELKADGVRTSRSRLSVWLSSWSLKQAFRHAENSTDEFQKFLEQKWPQLDPAELDHRASLFFQAEAMKAGDPETYLAFASARQKAKMDAAKLEQKERSLQLDERKLRLLEKRAAQAEAAEKVVGDAQLTPEQKQQKMRQIFGMPT